MATPNLREFLITVLELDGMTMQVPWRDTDIISAINAVSTMLSNNAILINRIIEVREVGVNL